MKIKPLRLLLYAIAILLFSYFKASNKPVPYPELSKLIVNHKNDHLVINRRNDYVVINGLKWDRENTTADGETHFTHEQAIALATKHGKRLPTVKELEALAALGSTWDDDLNGRWFGSDHRRKWRSTKSIFFPASGNRASASGAFNNVGVSGYGWSSSVTGVNGYGLSFDSTLVSPANNPNRANGFPVRCIQE